MATVTRDQFLESKGVQRKVFQKGTFLADADLNEQAQVLELIDRQTLAAMVGGTSRRISGLAVSYDTVDEIDVSAGTAVICRVSDEAVILRQESATTIDTSSLSDGSGRVLYIDIYEREVDANSDTDIVNPDVGEETCVDRRLTFSFAVANSVQTPGTDHYFITLATFTIASGIASSIVHSIGNHIYGDGKDFIVDDYIECDSTNGIVLKDDVEIDNDKTLKLSVDSVTAVLGASSTIEVDACVMRIASSGSSVTLTSTPTIQTSGIKNGQIVTLINDSTVPGNLGSITLQDETELTGSKLRLSAVSGGAGNNDFAFDETITLIYLSGPGYWYEIGRNQKDA